MWVVVPVKRFVNAKTRLASLMSESERESLAQVMLNDVLLAVSSSLLVSGVLIVSNEVRARYAVERLGGLFLEEEYAGLSASVAQAGKWLVKHGQRGMLIIPGDVPLVSSSEIDEIIKSHRGDRALTIAPDRYTTLRAPMQSHASSGRIRGRARLHELIALTLAAENE